jgi:UDP-N-acetylmuramoylalanine--D-glutamate ligase
MKKGANIVILGAGESGVGAAILSQCKDYTVFVSDAGKIADNYRNTLEEYAIEYEENGHTEARILQADIVIKSPGIPDSANIIQVLKEQNIRLIDELEWAARFTDATLIGVTGSNGKTTTARLIYHLLQSAGYDVGLAGNIGYSFAKQVALSDKAYYVLEVSSFQLDYIQELSFDVAVLLNVTPDHLDRYSNSMELYTRSKFRIIQNKTASQSFIYNQEDTHTQWGLAHLCPPDRTGFYGLSMPKLNSQSELFAIDYTSFSMPKRDLPLQGRHNLFNMQVAVLVADLIGLKAPQISKALATFVNETHRLETVIRLQEVQYINDSKATNVEAVYYALEAMPEGVVWIAGGVDKGNDYSKLYPLVKEKVTAIVCLGKDNSKLFAAFQSIQPIMVEALSMQEALKIASLYAEKGQVVLLSPACASFDLFNNYKDRGDQFKTILLQQHKAMTEGIEIQLNIQLNSHTVNQQTDEF